MSYQVDPDNPVVKLCVEGMEREQKGQHKEALKLFIQAWEQSMDAFDRAIAAHYVARHQPTPEAALHWNQASLTNADSVGDDRVWGFYPSLYLNMGKSYEDLGNAKDAKRFYLMASERSASLPESPYADVVRNGVANALQRVQQINDEP